MPRPLPRPTLSILPRTLLAGVLAVGAAAGPVGAVRAQSVDGSTDLTASVDWPPSGQRLRELATRLDFDIGFAARPGWPTLPEATLYGEIARTEFGTLVPEGSAKWAFVHPFEGEYDFDRDNDLDALVDFADANGMRVHGHPLTWYRINPPWLDTVPAERMEAVLRDHVETVVSRYAGRIDVWDVVNEGLDDEGTGFREEDPFFAALGARFIDIAFETARAADPDVELIYNDFGIGWLTPKSALTLSLVDDLIDRDIPIDGVGMQMHVTHEFPHFEGFSEAMQRFVDRDLDVYVTELDVTILSDDDLGVQAEVYEEVVRRCLMQPRCRALQIWGLSDKYSFQPFFRPLPFDEEFRVKPAYFGLQRALMTQPVHPERCVSEGTRVARGTVYAAEPGEGYSLVCRSVPLEGGFTSLTIRYRNSGTDTATLSVSAGGTPLASVALAPTPPVDGVDYRTVTVAVPPTAGEPELSVSVGAVSDGAEVGVDALLFGDPSSPLPTPPEAGTTGGSGGGGALAPLALALLAALRVGRRRDGMRPCPARSGSRRARVRAPRVGGERRGAFRSVARLRSPSGELANRDRHPLARQTVGQSG